MQHLMNDQQVAEYLGLTVKSVRKLAHEGGGPRFSLILSGLRRYRPEDVEAWVLEQQSPPPEAVTKPEATKSLPDEVGLADSTDEGGAA